MGSPSQAANTVGILGGGQLAMMLAQAAGPLGLRCMALDPDPACPASHECEIVVGAYDDPDALDRLADACGASGDGGGVVTFEFENVPAASAERLAGRLPVRPGARALEVAQDRLFERRMFAELGIDAPAMRAVDSLEDLTAAIAELGGPAILKSRRQGYDGKGQSVLRGPQDAERAWIAVGRVPAILDRTIPFVREVSVIATRAVDGSTAVYPLNDNQHANGILCVTRAPALGIDPGVAAAAQDAARKVLDHLDYIGTIAVEFFQVGEGSDARLLANEIAPRVHNTGHWTIEGCQTSQFANHIRAVTGMDLGPTDAVGHAAMVNIIGVHEPADARAGEDAHWHDYHKAARPGRKLGHVTVVRETPDERDTAVRGLLDTVGVPA